MKKNCWKVKMRCTVVKDIYVEDCSKVEAFDDPFSYAVDEVETEMVDWKILEVSEDL